MNALSLLVLRCTDIKRCREFYECFGLSFGLHAHGKGPQHYAAEDERGVFELYPASDAAPADQVGLGFRSSDLSEIANRLRSAGFSPGEISENEWGRSFVVRDPQNRRVEVSAA